jgi:nicotinic acid mononucleotide adenylyltransferase
MLISDARGKKSCVDIRDPIAFSRELPVAASRETPEHLIHRIADNALTEFRMMMGTLGDSACTLDFASLEQCTLTSLSHIRYLLEENECSPWTEISHSPGQPQQAANDRMVRIGVFPLAANPLHWAHLIGGLFVMEEFHLDKVVYVVAGEDPRKPLLASTQTRHEMARSVLELFHPLFAYSSVAREGNASGEENLFKILAMNPRQRMHAFYIAGGDHYHRHDPVSGRPDTIQKLEDGIARLAETDCASRHSVSVVFLRRGGAEDGIETSLDVRWVGGPPVETSSTVIRSALPNPSQWEKLSTLPFAAFSSICENHLYEVHTGSLSPFPAMQ